MKNGYLFITLSFIFCRNHYFVALFFCVFRVRSSTVTHTHPNISSLIVHKQQWIKKRGFPPSLRDGDDTIPFVFLFWEQSTKKKNNVKYNKERFIRRMLPPIMCHYLSSFISSIRFWLYFVERHKEWKRDFLYPSDSLDVSVCVNA